MGNMTGSNNKENKKINWNNVFFSLGTWIISNIIIIVTVLTLGGNSDLSVPYRVLLPVASFFSDFTNSKTLDDFKNTVECAAWKEQSLSNEKHLDSLKSSIDSFTMLDTSVARLTVAAMHETKINEVLDLYNTAKKDIADLKKGRVFKSTAVFKAAGEMESLNSELNKEFLQQYAREMSKSFTEYQQSITLAYVLNKSALGAEYKIDSIGLRKNKNGVFDTLVINGYRRFNPEKIKLQEAMSTFGLKKEADETHDLVIYFLKSDNKDAEKYYGKKSDFDTKKLYSLCGCTEKNGMYMKIDFPGILESKFYCSRIHGFKNEKKDFIVIDWRPQKWNRWSIVKNDLSPKIVSKLRNKKQFSVKEPVFSIKCPADELLDSHSAIDEYLYSKLTADIISEKDIVATPKTVSEIILPQKKLTAQDFIDAGHEFEKVNNYPAAYEQYAKAAEHGSEVGTVNCSLLLASDKVTFWNKGNNISYSHAVKLAEQIIGSSKDRKLIGCCYNIIGVIYNKGGYGINRNIYTARKYFNLAISFGDKIAEKNLKDLNATLKNRRRY